MKGNNCLKFFTLTWIKRPLELQKAVETNLSSTVRNFLPKLDADESVEDCAWNEYRNTHNFFERGKPSASARQDVAWFFFYKASKTVILGRGLET